MPAPSSIRWPPDFEPESDTVHVHNEIDLAVPPERVWEKLIDATSWPVWYPNSRRVHIKGSSPKLAFGTRFRWWTFNIPIKSTVLEFEPYERLAWNAEGPFMFAHHAWLITPTPHGCHVVTEERQHGLLAKLHRRYMPDDMHDKHQMWLDGLKGCLESS